MVIRETGGLVGAQITSVFFAPTPVAGGTVLNGATCILRPKVTAGGTWNLEKNVSPYCNGLDEERPPTHLFVTVQFVGDDGKAGVVGGSWDVSTLPE